LNIIAGNGPDVMSYAALLLRKLGYQELKDLNPRQHLLMRRSPDYRLFDLDTDGSIGTQGQWSIRSAYWVQHSIAGSAWWQWWLDDP
jgi:hypothetical protein